MFTDPPYFGNVQYGELMDFCYVWLRRLAGNQAEGFDRRSTRSPRELTGNATGERGLDHFTEGLASVYTRMARALKPGAPLAFTFHHNKLEAYYAVGIAILDAGLVCEVAALVAKDIRADPDAYVDAVFGALHSEFFIGRSHLPYRGAHISSVVSASAGDEDHEESGRRSCER